MVAWDTKWADNWLMSQTHQSLVRLPESRAQEVMDLLQSDQEALLFSEVEILELGTGSRALIWIYEPGGKGASRIGSCLLSPGQWAEALLCLDKGMRPVFELTWRVLGRLSDGRFALGAEEPPMHAKQGYAAQPIEELIG